MRYASFTSVLKETKVEKISQISIQLTFINFSNSPYNSIELIFWVIYIQYRSVLSEVKIGWALNRLFTQFNVHPFFVLLLILFPFSSCSSLPRALRHAHKLAHRGIARRFQAKSSGSASFSFFYVVKMWQLFSSVRHPRANDGRDFFEPSKRQFQLSSF